MNTVKEIFIFNLPKSHLSPFRICVPNVRKLYNKPNAFGLPETEYQKLEKFGEYIY